MRRIAAVSSSRFTSRPGVFTFTALSCDSMIHYTAAIALVDTQVVANGWEQLGAPLARAERIETGPKKQNLYA